MASIAGSGICELTNQSQLGIQEWALKTQELKPEGDCSAAGLDSMRTPVQLFMIIGNSK